MSDVPSAASGPTADERTAWARELLGLPPDDQQPLPGALCARLAEACFCPPTLWTQAFDLLAAAPGGGDPPADPPHLAWRLQQPRRQQVEQFAAEYFRLPPDVRRRRWEQLWADGQFAAPLRVRLAALAPGLDADPSHLPPRLDARVRKLIEHLVNTFPQPPHVRQALDAALLRAAAADRRRWRNAARWLLGNQPTWVRLSPLLISRLITPPKPAPETSAPPKAAAPAERTAGYGGMLWMLIIFVSAGARLLSTQCDQQHRPARSVPSYSQPFDPLHAAEQQGAKLRQLTDDFRDTVRRTGRLPIHGEPPPGAKPYGDAIKQLLLGESFREYQLYEYQNKLILVRKPGGPPQRPPDPSPPSPAAP